MRLPFGIEVKHVAIFVFVFVILWLLDVLVLRFVTFGLLDRQFPQFVYFGVLPWYLSKWLKEDRPEFGGKNIFSFLYGAMAYVFKFKLPHKLIVDDRVVGFRHHDVTFGESELEIAQKEVKHGEVKKAVSRGE